MGDLNVPPKLGRKYRCYIQNGSWYVSVDSCEYYRSNPEASNLTPYLCSALVVHTPRIGPGTNYEAKVPHFDLPSPL